MQRGVEIRDLRKSFVLKRWQGMRRVTSEVVAVDGINLKIPAGQCVAFIGPNGAGKSTTIKILTGILHPNSGEVCVAGYVPWQDRRRLAYEIGTVFGQRSQLWYHLPAADTFELLSRIYSLDRAEFLKTRDTLIDRFALGAFLQTPVRKLSLGQRMRAEVAASLLHRPKILFLDEPTIGLDVIARQELRDLLREWNKEEGATVILTSHDAGDIEHVAERVVVINQGRIIVDEDVATVRRRYLGRKILRVQFHESPREVSLSGMKLMKRSLYELKLEIDTTVTSAQLAIARMTDAGSIADLAIEDPPLEEVIGRIYAQAAAGGAP
jgi:ABC-2 type transport system ATP-binding protein